MFARHDGGMNVAAEAFSADDENCRASPHDQRKNESPSVAEPSRRPASRRGVRFLEITSHLPTSLRGSRSSSRRFDLRATTSTGSKTGRRKTADVLSCATLIARSIQRRIARAPKCTLMAGVHGLLTMASFILATFPMVACGQDVADLAAKPDRRLLLRPERMANCHGFMDQAGER